jgi:crotonobetainyl-CoA:carnitine CoA-transferase CaiB-like acyl-CoA transferase
MPASPADRSLGELQGLLRAMPVRVVGDAPSACAARRLLRALGAVVDPHDDVEVEAELRVGDAVGCAARAAKVVIDVAGDPGSEWAACGAMSLTGRPDGPPLDAPAPIAVPARGAAAVLQLLTRAGGHGVVVDGPALLGERAALTGLTRAGDRTVGGHGRLLRTADGWCAVSLPRAEDRELVPAWLEEDGPTGRADVWPFVAREVEHRSTADVVPRARMLGLMAAPLQEPGASARDEQARARGQGFPWAPWLVDGVAPVGPPCTVTRASAGRIGTPLVVDLSALWAGPLAANLLGLAGARVVKVEDRRRPDGTRHGSPALFDLLHAGHESVAVDLSDGHDRARVQTLLERADVVVESSRPRALEALGLHAEHVRDRNPGVVWLSITGYGATGPGRNWAALGDDAAVGAGLAVPTADGPVFCADAIADPLTGLHAAVAVVAALVARRGVHLDVALREVAGYSLGDTSTISPRAEPARRSASDWTVTSGGVRTVVAAPRARAPSGRAPRLGEHTAAVLDGR